MSESEDDDRSEGLPSIYDPTAEPELPPVGVATLGDDDDMYVDTDTGKLVRTPKPCFGCRAFDHRFSLEMDEESSKVYREAKYCKLSYTFISSWCAMLFFATIASAGIIAIGFLDEKLLSYQIVGIVLTIIFGSLLPVFLVFWICLQRRAKEVRQEYQAERNRAQVFEQENPLPVDDDEKDFDKPADDDEEDFDKPAVYNPPPGPPDAAREDLQEFFEGQ